MLLHIDGEIVEIRPGELFDSNKIVKSRYLELINPPLQKKPKRSYKPKPKFIEDEEDGSTQSRS